MEVRGTPSPPHHPIWLLSNGVNECKSGNCKGDPSPPPKKSCAELLEMLPDIRAQSSERWLLAPSVVPGGEMWSLVLDKVSTLSI